MNAIDKTKGELHVICDLSFHFIVAPIRRLVLFIIIIIIVVINIFLLLSAVNSFGSSSYRLLGGWSCNNTKKQQTNAKLAVIIYNKYLCIILVCFTWPVSFDVLLDHFRDDIPELVGCMRHTPAISLITHFLFPIILMDDILYSKKRKKEVGCGSCSEWMNTMREVLTFLHLDHTTGRTSGGMEEAFPPGRCRPSPGENSPQNWFKTLPRH